MVRPKLINQGSPDGENSKETTQNSEMCSLSFFKLPFPGVHPIMIKTMTEFTLGKGGFCKIVPSEPKFRFYQRTQWNKE